MKIIINGKRPSTSKRFKCDNCGCVFDAKRGEYEGTSQMDEVYDHCGAYNCKCPCCGQTVYTD